MISEIFAALSQALAGSFGIALLAALAWGVLSILLSPCHLSSIPLIIGYINTQGHVSAKRSFNLSAIFALGLLFGVDLGPCTFAYMAPVLGTVFHLSQTSIIQANSLLLAFGLGHVAVIVGAGSFGNWVQRYLNWTDNSRALVIVKRICGALVLAGGFYLIAKTL